jgi:hypothetical protein
LTGDDFIDDPLSQLGLAQLGIKISRDYEDLNRIKRIRKEQKKLEARLTRRNKELYAHDTNSPTDELEHAELISSTNEKSQFEMKLKELKDYFFHNLSPSALSVWVNSPYGRMWMVLQILCTLLSIFNYVFLTYSLQKTERTNIKELDATLAVLFLADYALSMYIAEDRLAFYLNPSSMIDLIAIVPPFVYLVVNETSHYVWFLGLLRILRASRILRTYRIISFSETEEVRELTIAVLTFCNFIFLSASVINALETIHADSINSPKLTRWHDSLYYSKYRVFK